ncbi:calcium-binding protein [Roseovarius aestuariivivens]|uniref:calcium-binding protein n=1 Tax=Roseovarius aestuariivivens TaxID=1888910 RepID=UPI0010810891|nr:calcium-binding protein [Roseovarius aestuariivivens]
MTTYSLTGFSFSRDAADNVTNFQQVTFNVAFEDGFGNINYSIVNTLTDSLPEVDIEAPGAVSVTVDGFNGSNGLALPDAAISSLGFITTPQGTHILLVFETENDPIFGNVELIFQIGGDPLTLPTSAAEVEAIDNSITDVGGISFGPFAPGQDIPFSSFLNVQTTENDLMVGTPGDDSLAGGIGNDTLRGEEGNDLLNGGPGDDLLNPGDNDGSVGDFLQTGTGNDQVDFGDVVTGFVSLDYSFLNGTGNSITVNIDGGANTGSVIKGAAGTDTLIQVDNPLFAGWTTGGLSVRGTSGNDVFNLAPQGQQWMDVRGGAGIDSFTINGTGQVRMDFRDATQGIGINLATGQIANDGFGNAETIGGTGSLWEVQGSGFNDTFTGSAADESYRYWGGNNTLNGGPGFDRLRYDRGTVESVVINAQTGVVNGVLSAGGTFTDGISGFEWLRGSNGNDSIAGDSANNLLQGRNGNDTLAGGGGNDTLDGGGGSDLHIIQTGATQINGFTTGLDQIEVQIAGLGETAVNTALNNASNVAGGAQVNFGSGNTVFFAGLTATDVAALATGTPANVVPGTDGDDFLNGSPGDDLIVTGDATPNGDFVNGTTGNDTIDMGGIGDSGFVTLNYSAFDGVSVSVNGSANTGSIQKGPGGADGTDTLLDVINPLLSGWVLGGLGITGSPGNDSFNVAPHGEQWLSIRPGDGVDSFTINGTGLVRMDYRDATQGVNINLATGQIANDGFGNPETIGGAGTLWEVQGSSFNDMFTGSAADESYRYFGGDNMLEGGLGFDRLRYDRPTVESVVLNAQSGVANGVLSAGGTFTDMFSNFEWLRGANGNDNILGAATDERLEGRNGIDTINGFLGDDTIDGGAGADLLIGGPGSDRIYVDDAGDRVAESRKWAGHDTVVSEVDFRMGRKHIEDLELTGTARLGAGNGLQNRITGNDADNVIDGGKNNDTMVGGLGDDRYILRTPGDVIVEEFGEGNDVVLAYQSYALAAHVEQLFMQTVRTKDGSPAIFNGIGNGLDNTIVGTPFSNTIVGREGRDTLKGQRGADTFVFDRAIGPDNVDRIIDFNTNEANEGDRLLMKGTVFGGMAAGVLSAADFVAGTAAADASDRFIFDQASGQLWFDADGSGAGAQELIATFEQNATVTAADIEIF